MANQLWQFISVMNNNGYHLLNTTYKFGIVLSTLQIITFNTYYSTVSNDTPPVTYPLAIPTPYLVTKP